MKISQLPPQGGAMTTRNSVGGDQQVFNSQQSAIKGGVVNDTMSQTPTKFKVPKPIQQQMQMLKVVLMQRENQKGDFSVVKNN